MIKVDVIIDNNKWKKKIKRANFFFNKILRFFPKKYKFEKKKILFSLSLSDNQKIRKLNKKFRKKNKSTNVLSFTNEDISKSLTGNLGDIAVSYEFLEEESKQLNKNFDDHIIHMLIHGVYHILGLDHENDATANKMENKEIELLKELNIKNPY
jgi:probable rRNA maturation factor